MRQTGTITEQPGSPTVSSTTASNTGHGQEPDRRERKKRQTRDALVRAALELFMTKGYEETTVREITDAVDVATRTFFRYFASKEDLVVSISSDFSVQLFDELADRPATEEPLVALRAAFAQTLQAFTEDTHNGGTDPIYLAILKMVENTPSLLAAQLRNAHAKLEELVRAVADREGVDPAVDLRPRIAANVFMSMAAMATSLWITDGGTEADELLDQLDAGLQQLKPALAGHWSASAS